MPLPSHITMTTTFRALALAIILALILTACGGGTPYTNSGINNIANNDCIIGNSKVNKCTLG